MIGRHLAAGRRRELLRLRDTFREPCRRDERRDPAVAETPGAAHRGLAVAADPQRERPLDRLRQHGDAIELPEFAGERDLVLFPAAAHDDDRLVGPTSALLEGHARGEEFTLLLDADPERGEHPAVREVIDHRELTRRHHGRAERRDEHARAELEARRARGDRGHRRDGLGHGKR